MSTRTQSPRPSSKTVAKRRAAARKRNRDFLRRFLAIFFVFIFVLGTATTAFIFTNQGSTGATTDTPTPVSAAQVSPGVATEVASGTQVVPSDLEKKGDDALAQNKPSDALSYYQAAAALDQSNAQLHYKIGNLLIQTSQYDSAADQLARAVELDPNGTIGTQAKALMDQNKDKLPTRVISTGVPHVVGAATSTITTATSTPTK